MRRKNATSDARKFIGTTKRTSVAIIGAGIGGLTAACAFARAGFAVDVFEQASELKEVGAGLQISPNGARALEALGIVPDGLAAEAVLPTDGLTGKAITRFDLAKNQPPYRFVHRARLLDQLASASRSYGCEIHLGARQEALPSTHDLVVGADGIHSVVRPLLNGPENPFFTGQVAWRAVAPVNADPVVRVWMLPGSHVVTYPLRDGLLNIVAVQERSSWADEGWNHPDTTENLLAAFSQAAPALRDILKEVSAPKLWGLFRHKIAERWHDKRVALIGDAAHPTLPFLAQGATLAIEDAYVLSRLCSEHGIETALPLYQENRIGRVRKAIAAANANAKNYHLRGPRRQMSFLALQGIGRLAPDAFLNRLSWLYDHDVTV